MEARPLATSPPSVKGWARHLHGAENLAVSLVLAAMVIVPLAESVLRKTLHVGIVGASSIVQHLGLMVGMLGGAIAARDGRLLCLSTIEEHMRPGPWKRAARIFSSAIAAAVAAFLGLASYQFVETEREAAKILVYGLPVWVVQLVFPAGFAVIALRMLWRSADRWAYRLAAAGLASILAAVMIWLPFTPGTLVIPALLLLAVASLLGIPAFCTLGGLALILFWGMDQPIASIPVAHYSLVTNPSLPTMPLFTLAGYFLAEGGAPRRLVRVFYSVFGRVRGGPAIVTVLVCAFFTSFTGASGVTILALGGLLMPVLLGARYSENNALGLVTGAGSLGLLFPPCLPLILFAIIAKVPIETMFLGGIFPGLVMLAALAWWGIRKGTRQVTAGQPFDAREAWRAVWDAKWELALPAVAVFALFGGIATPVEAAAITALYAFFIEVVVYGDLKIHRDIARVMTECGLLIGGVLLVLGVALGFTNYLVDAEIPARAVEWTTGAIHSKLLFLLLLNLFLLVVGCLMDIFSAIVVQVPLLLPLAAAFGISPVHLGIIFLANLELGYLTPPVGLNVYMSSYRFDKPVPAVYRATLPAIGVLSIGVLLITYFPAITLTLPRWLGR
jgi:C4-dicarboxylate transporter DctM subunit